MLTMPWVPCIRYKCINLTRPAGCRAAKLRCEETGLADLLSPLGEVPLDVQVQDIPATKSMPAHQHHDIRMLLTFEGGSEIRVRNEVLAASWFATGALRSRGIEEDILKAADKALRVLGRLPSEQP